ncbi:MAG: transposase [Alphaproteobacteria bacterium]|nr:transposase [Alphaproteobacteria bacterium]
MGGEAAAAESVVRFRKPGGRRHPADVQDRDGAHTLLRQARRRFPVIERIYGDGGYQGPQIAAVVAATGNWRLEIVKCSDAAGFNVLPKRRIVERTFAWIATYRRLAKNFERHANKAVTFISLAMIRIMLGRLITNHFK